MNDLLPKILMKIFGNLDLADLLNCRLVNRNFNKIIQRRRIKNLAISNNDTNNNQYFLSIDKINGSNTIQKLDYYLRSSFMNKILSKLNKLYVDCNLINNSNSIDIINFLNQFDQLEYLIQLEIDNLNLNKNSTLKLSKLKILSIAFDYFETTILRLDCKKLESFRSIEDFLNRYEFVYPDQLKYLHAYEYFEYYRKFTNIEEIILEFGDNMGDNIFVSYEKLKKLNFKDIGTCEQLAQLIEKKLNFESNIQIYCIGILLESVEECNNLFDSNGCLFGGNNTGINIQNVKIIKNNYGKLKENIEWNFNLQYNDLITEFKTIPADFKLKFTDLNIIEINGNEVINKQEFINFLKYYPNLNGLIIKSIELDQQFYDNQLNNYCKYLNRLEILDNIQILNLDFLLKYKFLKNIKIDMQMPFNLIRDLFKLNRLNTIDYLFNDANTIIKKESDHFNLKISDLNDNNFTGLDDLIEFLIGNF